MPPGAVRRKGTVVVFGVRWVVLGLLWCLLGSSAWAQDGRAVARTAFDPHLIEVFVREGCPHCAAAEEFVARLGRERPELKIVVRDVQHEPAALERLQEIVRAERAGVARVPAVYAGGQLILGYSPQASTDRLILAALAGARPASGASATAPSDDDSCEIEHSLACAQPAAKAAEPFEVSLFGWSLSLDKIGLPAFTLAIGLLDGFNPCSMWVLLLMISLLAPLNDRRRMVAIAGTFVLIQGIVYFLFMTAWLNLFLFIGLSRISVLIIAAIAIGAGLINMKDFFAFKWGFSLSIPDKAKPDIYNRIRAILHAENMAAAIAATVILALLVQIVEFMCTSGFPALFTRILTLSELDTATYYSYLLLYNAAYMLDDVIVLSIGVAMLSRHRLQENEGRWLKLASGVVMVGLGVYLLALA
jgi:glutaredoxin/cytochrome c biogenesis protein CcdA